MIGKQNYAETPTNGNEDTLKTLAEHFTQNRESLNSSGTVSRKTSTASDYTPEHTYILNARPPLIEHVTAVSYVTDTVVTEKERDSYEDSVLQNEEIVGETVDYTDALKNEFNDSLRQRDGDQPALVPGQKVTIKGFVLAREESQIVDGIDGSKDDIGGNVEEAKPTEEKSQTENGAGLKVPQRKISRFLVSPVLSGQLDMPKDKDFGEATQEAGADRPSELPDIKNTHSEALRKNSAPLENTRTSMELENKTEQKVSVCSLKEESITNREENLATCGPELINTLEQLKISLGKLLF